MTVTLEKKFQFATSAEGWAPNAGDAQVEMSWFPPKKRNLSNSNPHGHQDNAPLSIMGGCLRTTAKQSCPSVDNYWVWSGTWEDLGVPAGAIVASIIGEHLYRWDFTGSRARNRSVAEFAGKRVGSGPLEMRTSRGDALYTLSDREAGVDRDSGGAGLWRGYPAGGAGDAVSETPPSWAMSTGSEVEVELFYSASSTEFQLWLWNLTPDTAAWTAPDPPTYVRFKQDRVMLTITYTPMPSGSTKWFFSQ